MKRIMDISSKLLGLEVGAQWAEARPAIWDTKLNPQRPNEGLLMPSRLTSVSKYLSK
jgi:hypothetical protein